MTMTTALPTSIFLPVATLALWTLLVLLLVPIARFRAAIAGRVTVDDFKHGESSRVPADVGLPNRVFMNLLEVPLLFYLACITAFVTQHADAWLLNLAWVFVALRVLHALIYLSYNKVTHRLTAFAIGNVVVVTMWCTLLWRLLQA
jgi:hypothetical protein